MIMEELVMRESRLFKIVYHLLDKGGATAPELAEKFEVSVRTIYRDIDALSGAGIPVYAEAGRNGGIYLMNDFVLDKAALSEEEKQEILTALQSISSMNNIGSNQTLQKLSAIFHMSSENWLEVDFSRWGNHGTDHEKFELLKSAVIHQKCVKITYANSCGTMSERIVQPLKMAYKSMSWYLKAYCTKKQDYRIFKLTRMIDLEILTESFCKRSFPELDETPGRAYNTIVLRFPKNMAYRVYDEFDKTWVSKNENGDFIVSVEMPEDEWLIGYLLSFGTQVDIIEPVYLRDIVAEQAKKIYEKYF
jgi:predicted DNA-binding transcriptional regulator YafY